MSVASDRIARGGDPARQAPNPAMWARARAVTERLADALAREDYAGWDPYDALSSPALRALARSRRLRQGAIQALRRSPLNVRPLVGVPKQRHTKGIALVASGLASLATTFGDEGARLTAKELAADLVDRAIPAGGGVGWGYDFDVQTRWGYYRRGVPNAVVTAFVAHALLDVASDSGDEGAEAARAAVDYACCQLLRESAGERYFAYFAGSRTPVHNASLLLVSLVARCAGPGSSEWHAAQDAVGYSLARQRADGTWPYGEGRGLEWVDGFHTAYVLESLAGWQAVAPAESLQRALERGLGVYVGRLVDPDGAPRATLASRFPLDVHAAASGISMLTTLAPSSPGTIVTAERLLGWVLSTMVRRDGRFAFQRQRLVRNSVPYVRWSDGHMLRALARYLQLGVR
ncbi:MAG: hypothetical protein M3296_02390 [Actinomycetota bacterium]|nr:hypothetical protein [Actinomycetota bacterium]